MGASSLWSIARFPAIVLLAVAVAMQLAALALAEPLARGTRVVGQWTTTPPDFNDIWGYADETGNEYALLGASSGTWVLNVTDPGVIVPTGFISGPTSGWRDVKVHGDFAYVVTEGVGGGLQIVDLTDPQNPTLVPHPTNPGSMTTFDGFSTAHNIYVDSAGNRAYPCGTESNIMPILDVSVPTAPVELGSYDLRYVHDLFVRNHIGYLAEVNSNTLTIVDLTDPQDVQVLGSTGGVPTAHNTWLNEAGTHVFVSEEAANGLIRVYDVQDPGDIQLAGSYSVGEAGVIPHNALAQGERLFVSYYTSGLRVLDVVDPTYPVEIASYDTWPGSSGGFLGAWGVYPFLPSGRVLVSDILGGLFVVELDDLGAVAVMARDATDGNLLRSVRVELVGQDQVLTDSRGRAGIGVPPGQYLLRLRRDDYAVHEEAVEIQTGERVSRDIALQPVPIGLVFGTVTAAAGPLEGGQVSVVGFDSNSPTDAAGFFVLTNVPRGDRLVRIVRPGYATEIIAVAVGEVPIGADATLTEADWYDDANSDRGWSLAGSEDTATAGFWTRVTPRGTSGGLAQPGLDATPGPGGLCFVTTNVPGDPNAGDVDGGTVTLTSPPLAVAGLNDPRLSYARWFANALPNGSTGTDGLLVQVSDDGLAWVLVERVETQANVWTRVELRLSNFVSTDGSVWIRFIASDEGNDDMVEAAVDDVTLYGWNTVVAAVVPRLSLADEGPGGVRVEWEVPTVTGVEWLEVQRSHDSQRYATVRRWERGDAHSRGAWRDRAAPSGSPVSYRAVAGVAGSIVMSEPAVAQRTAIPPRSRLLTNVPNPFNPVTRLRLELQDSRGASLTIFDTRGRRVTSWNLSGRPPGMVEIEWDGRDAQGRTVGSGSYIVRLAAGDGASTRAITLLQ